MAELYNTRVFFMVEGRLYFCRKSEWIKAFRRTPYMNITQESKDQETMTLIEEIKQLRVDYDGFAKHVQALHHKGIPYVGTNCYQHYMTAKLWLGKALEALEVDNPYKLGNDKTTAQLEPTADTSSVDTPIFPFAEKDKMIIALKELREEAKTCIIRMDTILQHKRFEFRGEAIAYYTLSKRSLELAIMWTGVTMAQVNEM